MIQAAHHFEQVQALNAGARQLFNLYPRSTKVAFPVLIGGRPLKACAVWDWPGVVRVFCLDSGETIASSAPGFPLDLAGDSGRTASGQISAAPSWPALPESLVNYWAYAADAKARRAALLAGAELLADTYPRQSRVSLSITPGREAVDAYAVLLWPGVVRVAMAKGAGVIAQSRRGEPFALASLPRHLMKSPR